MVVPGATHFYRYCSAKRLDWLEPILLKHQLYFPKPAELNDPAEGRPRLESKSARQTARFFMSVWRSNHPSATLDEIAATFGDVSTAVARFGLDWMWRESTTLLHRELSEMHILSMSRRWNNMSMWAKYADNHTGYCLEFANAGLFAAAREVEYGDIAVVDVTDTGSMDIAFFFRKKNDWSNEEEVRILGPTFWPSLISFDPTLLTRVILGKEMASKHRSQIRRWAFTRSPNVTVVEVEYDQFDHTLKVAPADRVTT